MSMFKRELLPDLASTTDAVLQPRNPFEPANRRRPKPAVAIAISLFAVLALVFLYFSFQHKG